MAIHLVVAKPFADYQIGDQIVDQAEIQLVLSSAQHTYVRRVDATSLPPRTS